MSIPSVSMRSMRSGPSARPPAWRSNGVPFTTSETPSTVQCEWTSMTFTRLPPTITCLRTTGPRAAGAPAPRPRPAPPARCAHAGSSRPATYAPAAAPAIVLKKSLRFCMTNLLRGRGYRELEQLDQIAAEDHFLLRIGEELRIEHEV